MVEEEVDAGDEEECDENEDIVREEGASEDRDVGEEGYLYLLEGRYALCDSGYAEESLIDDLCESECEEGHSGSDNNLVAAESDGTEGEECCGDESADASSAESDPGCDGYEFSGVEGADHPEKCADEHHPFDSDV